MVFWLVVLVFILAQNLQVGLYGWVFRRAGSDSASVGYIVTTFKEPVFWVALLGLSMATAVCRLWLFPSVGIARTHVVTSAAVVLTFAILSVVFGEHQGVSRYFGAIFCAFGIYLVAR